LEREERHYGETGHTKIENKAKGRYVHKDKFLIFKIIKEQSHQ